MNRREFLATAGAAPALGLLHQEDPSSSPAPHPSDIWIEVDLDRIGFNLESVRRKARGRKVMAVVKANGYGHGLAALGRYLDGKGVDGLMVGNFREALALRKAGVRATILNFGPAFAAEPRSLIEQELSQVVFTADVETLASEARRLGKEARIHVLIDTGLGRLGVPHHQAPSFIEKLSRLAGIRIEGVMTAFTEDRDFDPVPSSLPASTR
jgi:alanine racemase